MPRSPHSPRTRRICRALAAHSPPPSPPLLLPPPTPHSPPPSSPLRVPCHARPQRCARWRTPLTARAGSQAYALAAAPEAAPDEVEELGRPFKTPARRALEEEIRMVSDHAQEKAAGLDKWGKKVTKIQMATPNPTPTPTPNLNLTR